jgi:hypothetical protein
MSVTTVAQNTQTINDQIRAANARELAARPDAIQQHHPLNSYRVASLSGRGAYIVDFSRARPTCGCLDYEGKNSPDGCQHIRAVRIYRRARRYVAQKMQEESPAAVVAAIRAGMRAAEDPRHVLALRTLYPLAIARAEELHPLVNWTREEVSA